MGSECEETSSNYVNTVCSEDVDEDLVESVREQISNEVDNIVTTVIGRVEGDVVSNLISHSCEGFVHTDEKHEEDLADTACQRLLEIIIGQTIEQQSEEENQM